MRYRKAQGYNWVNVIAAFPNWMTDGAPWHVVMNDPEKTTVRSAWLEFGAGSAKNMDNEGGRPFLFPGKVPGYEQMFPDVDRINPEYFRYVDRKIDYLNEHGFVPFIEVSRREMWDAFQWRSASQMRYLRDFAFSIGKRYQELEPNADLASPNKTPVLRSYEGWAYAARTPDKNIFLVYFEKGCPRSQIRGARLNSTYRAQWFDPRDGSWRDAGRGTVRSSAIGIIMLPEFPGDNDWGLRLTYEARGIPGSGFLSLPPAAARDPTQAFRVCRSTAKFQDGFIATPAPPLPPPRRAEV